MPLFQIQDSDRPMWIVAQNYGEAEDKWRKLVAKENDMSPEDIESPYGISFICEDNDFMGEG